LEAGQIAGKRTEIGVRLGFEDENPDRNASVSRKLFVPMRRIINHGPSSPPKLLTLRRTARRSGAFILVAEDQSPLFQIMG
jgi:hypothetical protein